jgi:hypothetical protein
MACGLQLRDSAASLTTSPASAIAEENQKCVRCGSISAATENFCGGCGCSLEDRGVFLSAPSHGDSRLPKSRWKIATLIFATLIILLGVALTAVFVGNSASEQPSKEQAKVILASLTKIGCQGTVWKGGIDPTSHSMIAGKNCIGRGGTWMDIEVVGDVNSTLLQYEHEHQGCVVVGDHWIGRVIKQSGGNTASYAFTDVRNLARSPSSGGPFSKARRYLPGNIVPEDNSPGCGLTRAALAHSHDPSVYRNSTYQTSFTDAAFEVTRRDFWGGDSSEAVLQSCIRKWSKSGKSSESRFWKFGCVDGSQAKYGE